MSEALLSCSGLSVRFGGLVALDALDLEVRSGAILGLIGPNGSGKTTLFNVITGVYRAAGGRAQLSGQDLTGMTPQRIYAAGVTRTFQRSRLALPLSVFDNVMIGNHRLLHHGLWFNLFRRSQLRREFESNLAKARALVATFSARLAERLFDAAGVQATGRMTAFEAGEDFSRFRILPSLVIQNTERLITAGPFRQEVDGAFKTF